MELSNKKFILTIEVDINKLTNSYMGGEELENAPDLETMLWHECSWVAASGLNVTSIEEVEELKQKTSIFIEWNIEDVQEVAKERFNRSISNKNAFIVLEFIKAKHDASIGISWMVIEEAIETLLERKEITLNK